ncbi:hypothetical protein YC2023_056949 [Brassica napus]
MAFKAMMKKRTRRRYECLSTSGGTTKESYVDEYFFPLDDILIGNCFHTIVRSKTGPIPRR